MKRNTELQLEKSYNGAMLTLKTGYLARQATASVLASYGETTVLASVVVGKKSSMDYLPLQVIYEERLYATGKIKGSRFIKREGKPSDNAVLTGRLIDRSVRSLFNSNIRNEIQIIITVLSVDEIHTPDTLSVLAASSALQLCDFYDEDALLSSNEVFAGGVSAVRIGLKAHSFGDHIIPQIEGIVSTSQSFDDILKPLEEVCSILDSGSVEDQEYIRRIYGILNQKNPQWATRFRELEKNTPQLTHTQITEKYNLLPDFIVQPSYDQMKLSQLDLVVSGNQESITMIEAGAQIIPESVMNQALDKAQQELANINATKEKSYSI